MQCPNQVSLRICCCTDPFLSGFECDNEQDRVDGLNSVDFTIESVSGYSQTEDRTFTGVNPLKYPISPDVKEAIKSMYTAGVTKPMDIWNSLSESGVTDEGGFKINQLYNYLKNMKKQMGVKTRSK